MDNGIVNIHGKKYKTVALRVSEFRAEKKYDGWCLTTEIIECGDPVIMKAEIWDGTGRRIATGHAEELRSASQINRTSALENCETSAIGRALAALGLAGSEFASADEVANAIGQQKNDTHDYCGDVVADFQASSNKKALQAVWAKLSPRQQSKYRGELDARLEEL